MPTYNRSALINCAHGRHHMTDWSGEELEACDVCGAPNVPQKPLGRQTVWVVQGHHPTVHGCPLTVHMTKASADAEAASLVEIMRGDLGLKCAVPTSCDWEGVLNECRSAAARDGENCDVWILEAELKP